MNIRVYYAGLPVVVCAQLLLPHQLPGYDSIYSGEACYEAVLSHIYNYDLGAAEKLVDSLIAESPADAKPYFFKTLVRWWYFIGDFNSKPFRTSFIQTAEKAIEVGENQLDARDDNTEALFFVGASYGYLARYYVLTGSWLDAYSSGKKARSIFSDMITRNDTLYDAYLGVGIYNYYADKLPTLLRFFSTILGLGGDRQLGLEQLRLAADSGVYSRVEALSMLGFIDVQYEQNFNEAVGIFSKLSDRYKTNPVFRIFLGNSYRESGNYGEAISMLTESLDDESVKYASVNQLAGMHAELAFCYMLAKEYGRAVLQYKICDSLAVGDYVKESPWIYYNAGLCEEREHNYAEAEVYYRKVLDCRDYFDYHSNARKSIERVRSKHGTGH